MNGLDREDAVAIASPRLEGDEDSAEYRTKKLNKKCCEARASKVLELNNFSIKSIPATIFELDDLQALDLSANDISRVPPQVVKLRDLRKLRLNHNLLFRFPPVLTKLASLTQLYLNHNHLKGIPESICELRNLRRLDCSVNQILALPDSIVQLSNLTHLDLHRNELSVLPSHIHSMTHLQMLKLEQNPLDCVPQHLIAANDTTGILRFMGTNSGSHPPFDGMSSSSEEEEGSGMTRDAAGGSVPGSAPGGSGTTGVQPRHIPSDPLPTSGSSLLQPPASGEVSTDLEDPAATKSSQKRRRAKRARDPDRSPAEKRLKLMEAKLFETQQQLLEEQSARRDWQLRAQQLEKERLGGKLKKMRKDVVEGIPDYEERTFQYEVPYHELELKQQVGSGGFGDVYCAGWRGTVVAVKTLRKSNFDAKILEDLRREVALMCTLRHPNIILFMGACTRPPQPCIVTEYLALGSLADVLENNKIMITWGIKLNMMLDIARGMFYLHTKNPPIIHRDLKSDNIMVAKDFRCVVADFGLAKVKRHTYMQTNCGTPGYTAPEIFMEKPYTEKADVYSYGMVMWEITTRRFVFSHVENPFHVAKAVERGDRPEVPSWCPAQLGDVMKSCWHPDPAMRPAAPAIIGRVKSIIDTVLPNLQPGPLLR